MTGIRRYDVIQGRLSLSTNGATDPWPFFEGDIFQLKIYFLKLYDLQPFYSVLFLRMFRQFSLICVFDVWYVTCFTVTDT